MLWEITAPGGERGALFGTIHALPDDAKWRTPALDAALADSDLLVVEVANLGDTSGAELFSDLSETPGQPPLSRRVDAEARPALLAMMDAAGMDDGDFSRIESWGAALLLAAATRTGDSDNGVDRALIAEADEVVGLESYAGQLSLFDRLSQEAQGDLLAATARDWQAGRGDAMLRAWLSGDERRIAEHVGGELLSNPELRRTLLTRRNEAWTDRIAALVEEGRRPFVAVGAAHLVGEDGLVARLEALGYTARRIQ
ncbi:TraB/GumN family protein [Aurantiacibacter luteus]|nr:TraB/GumN family protein [Aurantiacibacter luteus]